MQHCRAGSCRSHCLPKVPAQEASSELASLNCRSNKTRPGVCLAAEAAKTGAAGCGHSRGHRLAADCENQDGHIFLQDQCPRGMRCLYSDQLCVTLLHAVKGVLQTCMLHCMTWVADLALACLVHAYATREGASFFRLL